MNARVFGDIDGVPGGTLFASRAELAAAGVHRPTQAGISGGAKEGADSIVLSGGYEDDEDYGDEIIYTGHGGNDPLTRKQAADQELTAQNLALAISCREGLPIRVTRGAEHQSPFSPLSGYRYDGLYYVDRFWPAKGRSGYRIWRFRLVRDPSNLLRAEAIHDQTSLSSPPELLDAVDAVTERATGRSPGQGFRISVAARKAIEDHAMRGAKSYFAKAGWTEVRDVSRARPYDLHCSKANEELRVEVKGTTSDGSVILLTSGEVVQARAAGASALYILSGIEVTENEGTYNASGGNERVITDWEIVDTELKPLAYRYKVPPPRSM